MSTRYGFAVLGLASIAGAATVASPLDLEGRLAPRLPGPNAAAAPRPVALRLVWTDPARAAAGLERLARAEAEDVLREMGVSVTWRRGDARELARPGEVRVILLDRPAARDPEVPVLGATPPTFAVSPFVWVHIPGVSASVGVRHPGGAGVSPLETRALAVAVGRVIAHEVVHAVAPSVPHGSGLMSASFTRRQLTAPRMPFDPDVALAVRAALRGDAALPRPDTGVLTAATAAEEVPR